MGRKKALKRVRPAKPRTQCRSLHLQQKPESATFTSKNITQWKDLVIPTLNLSSDSSECDTIISGCISENNKNTVDTNMSAGTSNTEANLQETMEVNQIINPVEALFTDENLMSQSNKRKNSTPNIQHKNKKLCETNKPKLDRTVTSKKTLKTSDQCTSTRNRYAPLQALPDTDIDNQEINRPVQTTNSTHANVNKNTNVNTNNLKTKTKIPSPIIIAAKTTQHNKLVEHIKSVITGEFTIKYTANNTNIYIKNHEDKRKYLENISKTTLQFHSYSDTKTHAFVLSGLPVQQAEAEIKYELENIYKLNIHNVYKMRGTFNTKYLIITDNSIKLKHLEKEIKYLLYTRIKWSRHENKKIITQCHNCQKWGHATSNCHRDPKCLKCGKGHITKQCDKLPNEPLKCANCGKPHTANNTECEHYKDALALLEARKIKQYTESQKANKNIKYVDAPMPNRSIWEIRNTLRQNTENGPSASTTTSQPTTIPERTEANYPTLAKKVSKPTRKIPARVNKHNSSSETDTDTNINIDTDTDSDHQPHKHYTHTTKRKNNPQKELPKHNQTHTQYTNNSASKLQELNIAVQELNKVANLDKIIKQIKELTSILKHCNNEGEKLLAMLEYCNNISK